MQPEYFDGIDCVERNFDPIRGLSKCPKTVFGMLFDFRYSIPLMTPETPLLNPNRPQSNKIQQGEVKKKSHYVIEAGLIWERNRCPGSDTRVACHG